jgi:hypothetical protein
VKIGALSGNWAPLLALACSVCMCFEKRFLSIYNILELAYYLNYASGLSIAFC